MENNLGMDENLECGYSWVFEISNLFIFFEVESIMNRYIYLYEYDRWIWEMLDDGWSTNADNMEQSRNTTIK